MVPSGRRGWVRCRCRGADDVIDQHAQGAPGDVVIAGQVAGLGADGGGTALHHFIGGSALLVELAQARRLAGFVIGHGGAGGLAFEAGGGAEEGHQLVDWVHVSPRRGWPPRN